jgi:hypothetical protein
VLNNAPPLSVGLDPDPFMHGQLGRRIRLVVDDETVGESLAVRLLEALGHRPSARVHWTRRPAPARVTLKPPVPERNSIPALVEDEDDSRETAIPACSSIRARSATLAQEHDLDPSDVERLLCLATLARTTKWIDAAIVGEQMLAATETTSSHEMMNKEVRSTARPSAAAGEADMASRDARRPARCPVTKWRRGTARTTRRPRPGRP